MKRLQISIRANNVPDAEGRCGGTHDRALLRRRRVAGNRVALGYGAGLAAADRAVGHLAG